MPSHVRPSRRASAAAALLCALAFVGTACSDDTSDEDAGPATTAAADGTTASTADGGDDPSTTVPTGSDPDSEGCQALRAVVDLQDELNARVGDGSDWALVRSSFAEFRDRIEGSYEAAAEANPDLATEIDQVTALTVQAIDVIVESPDEASAQQTIATIPGIQEAQAGGTAVNEYSQVTCGFLFAQ